MELYTFFGFMAILGESLKNFLKHGKLMASITSLILSIHSLLFLANTFSIKPLLKDLITNAAFLQLTTPGTSQFAKLVTAVRQDLQVFAGLEWIFIVTTYVTSIFCAATTILASGVTHRGIDISIKELLLRVVKSWKRPFITFFYLTLFELGYCFLTWATLIPLVLIFPDHVTLSAIIIFIPAVVFLCYLAVVWNLALVVSVLEEKCGIDALGRAGVLVKGFKLSGVFLNIVFGIPSLVVIPGFRLANSEKSTTIRLSVVLVMLNCLWLIKMFEFMAFTVFYYECKNNQGEKEIGSLEYTKLSTAEQVSADIP
ncbi:uncharacterized protein LOC112015528 [Quercus suber]|nr:uncharacterized protein LOC112015528 [Quercus suber]